MSHCVMQRTIWFHFNLFRRTRPGFVPISAYARSGSYAFAGVFRSLVATGRVHRPGVSWKIATNPKKDPRKAGPHEQLLFVRNRS